MHPLLLVTLLSLFPFASFDDVVVIFNHKQVTEEAYNDHIIFIKNLIENGQIDSYGRLSDGGAILLFKKRKIVEVKNILADDPGVKSGTFYPEYFSTSIRTGEFCRQDLESPDEYNFIRYTTFITKYNVQQAPQLLMMHDDYLKEIEATGNILAEGIFSNSDGGFMVIKGKLSEDVIYADPTYAAGFIVPEIKKVYFPEGTFCKK